MASIDRAKMDSYAEIVDISFKGNTSRFIYFIIEEKRMHTINITGHHLDITPAIKSHIDEKLGRVAKLSDQITSINITLLKDSKTKKAEATLHLPGKDIFAASSEDRLFHAIDSMIDKLARQIGKHKTKLAAGQHKTALA